MSADTESPITRTNGLAEAFASVVTAITAAQEATRQAEVIANDFRILAYKARQHFIREHILPRVREIEANIRNIQTAQEAEDPQPISMLGKARSIKVEECDKINSLERSPYSTKIHSLLDIRFSTHHARRGNHCYIGFDPIGPIDEKTPPPIARGEAETITLARWVEGYTDKILTTAKSDDADSINALLKSLEEHIMQTVLKDNPNIVVLERMAFATAHHHNHRQP